MTSYEIDLTHSGLLYFRPVALPQTQVRFVPDSIDSRRLDPWTVGQSVSELVTLPLLCESSDKEELSLKLHRCQQRHLNTLCPLKFTDYCCPPEEVHRSIGAPYAPIEGHVPTC